MSLSRFTGGPEHFGAHSAQEVEERIEICTGSARIFKLRGLLHEIQNCFKTKKIIFRQKHNLEKNSTGTDFQILRNAAPPLHPS